MRSFFAELKKRRVYRVALGYAVAAWLSVQVAATVLPAYRAPDWILPIFITVVALGFPVALVLAWAFDLTPTGIKTGSAGKRGAWWLAVFGLILGAFFAGSYLLRPWLKEKADGTPPSHLVTPAPNKSIAVLPFQNLSKDEENAFFTDGMQDEILTALAKVADLKVISRTSVLPYAGASRNLREIGRQLGVAHLMEGSVQRAGGRVRVIAQLIDARNHAQLWAEHYDRDLADVFAIQSEIAQAIAAQLQAKLSPREKAAIETPPTRDLAAHDLYLRAKALSASTTFSIRARDTFLEAVGLLEQAVARDPSFLLAHCQLASVHDRLYNTGFDRTPERLALAGAAVQAALRLAPDAGEAHLAQAEHLYRGFLDYEGARAELAIARRVLPNNSHVFALAGYIDRRQGHLEQSIANLERALELEPRNSFILQQNSLSYRKLRRYPASIAMLERALAISPQDIALRVERALVDLDWRGDIRPLQVAIDSILQENPAAAGSIAEGWITLALCARDPTAAERALVALGENSTVQDAIVLSRSFNEGLVARMRYDEAASHLAFTAARELQARIVHAQPDYAPALCVLGLIDAGLGRKEDALRAGRRAAESLPVEKDALNGPHLIEYFGVIAAWSGEKDLAFAQLEIASRVGGNLSYGKLKLHPFWDPLRGDPRFEKIVDALAPKS